MKEEFHITFLMFLFPCLLIHNAMSKNCQSLQQVPQLILLDRDGVINQDVGSPGVVQSSQLKLTPNAGKAIGTLKRAGYKVAMITNQSCVGKGLITEKYLINDIHGTLQEMLIEEDSDAMFDHIFYCTSVKGSCDQRMKPNPGMIKEACGLFDTNSRDCVLIGDAFRDLQAAASGEVPIRILVETGYGKRLMKGYDAPSDVSLQLIDEEFINNHDGGQIKVPEPSQVLPFYYAQNLDHAVRWIMDASSDDSSS